MVIEVREKPATIAVNTGIEGQSGTIADVVTVMIRGTTLGTKTRHPGITPNLVEVRFNETMTFPNDRPDIQVIAEEKGRYRVEFDSKFNHILGGPITEDQVIRQVMQWEHERLTHYHRTTT